MAAFGLTGGFGSGKSTVATLLKNKGATVIDADEIAREVVSRPSVLSQLEDRFGPSVITPEGLLSRSDLAEIVFGDPVALQDLNSLTHPLIQIEIKNSIEKTSSIVVADIPLLSEGIGQYKNYFKAIVVVDVYPQTAIQRLLLTKRFSQNQIQARIGAQDSRDQRLKIADFVIDNNGSLGDLYPQVDRLWDWMVDLNSQK